MTTTSVEDLERGLSWNEYHFFSEEFEETAMKFSVCMHDLGLYSMVLVWWRGSFGMWFHGSVQRTRRLGTMALKLCYDQGQTFFRDVDLCSEELFFL